jgi:hypothetical protein
VIFNIFDERNPSYNMLVLGQTGPVEDFATLLLMLRHLLYKPCSSFLIHKAT